MNIPAQIAKQLRDVHFGGNWTSVNLRDTLSDVAWEDAMKKIHSFNSIAALVYHIHYYVVAQLGVFKNGSLDAHDKYSFGHPPINNREDWIKLQETSWSDAEVLSALIGQFPEDRLGEDFINPKYGSYFRNLCGLIEHAHYHLGQVVVIKKLIKEQKE